MKIEEKDTVIVCLTVQSGLWNPQAVTPGSIEDVCIECNTEVHLSVAGQNLRKEKPEAKLLCLPCCRKAMKEAEAKGEEITTGLVPGAIEEAVAHAEKKEYVPPKKEQPEESKEEKSNIVYTGIILDETSHNILIEYFNQVASTKLDPTEYLDWKQYGHHMTINLGAAKNGPAANLVGQEFEIRATTLAYDDKVFAVGVETSVGSMNAQKHVTLAVNAKNGGKPKHSNDLKEWKPIPPLVLRGTVKEI